MSRRDAQPSQRALDRVVRHAFEALTPALDLAPNVGGHVQCLSHVIQQRLPSIMQHLAAGVDHSRRATLLFGKDDLRQRHLCEVLSVVAVDDFDLMAITHELSDPLERDVAAATSVVQLAVCVLLDKVSFGGCRHKRAHSNAVRQPLRAAPSWRSCMAKRKRTSRRTGLVGRAVSAGRRALKEAESRVPPDLRRQVERRLKEADKNARTAIKVLQTQVKRASTRADVNAVLKRIAGLAKQARQIARGTGSRAASTRRRAATTTRRAASQTKKGTGTARREAATRAPTT